MSCLSTTWFRFLLKLGSFFGKHLNEAQKGVSELECYNATVFVRNNEDARVGTCESTCLSQETPWRGGGMGTCGRSQSRGTSRQSENCMFGNSFPKRKSSSQIVVLWSASNEILKNSWQENIKNKMKQKKTTPWAPTHTKGLRISGTQALTFLKAPPPR